MLLPTEQAASTYLTDFMRGFVRDIEERQQEERKKAEGKREDKQQEALKAQIRPDESAAAANAKINAHFFGALKRDENPMATLISNFADALGLAQGSDESAGDFADRLATAVAFTRLVSREYADGQAIPVTLKTFGASADSVKSIMKGETSDKDDPKARLAARIGLDAGVDPESGDFSGQMEKALTDARGKLPKTVEEVEEKSGLRKLGLTAEELIEAIRRPWGDTARKVQAALDAQASDERTLTKDVAKVIQRLEDIADPKTSSELKAERSRDDPTRVEDAETRAEREKDIQVRESQEKVEDVKKRQDAIGEQIRGDGDPAKNGEGAPGSGGIEATEVIQVLAASAEASQTAAAAKSATATKSESPVDDGDPTVMSREEQIYLVENHSPEAAAEAQQQARNDILQVNVDDIGLYRLIGKDKKSA
ncbi:hypothetical protein P7F60_04070 [Rhizobium sp. YJ-22]|uniref:hypothetical protein n=1 Tax=Rhizobium sp. YJ-22 TaxID=3037556 RepID=UPI002412664F|nr:hypothetical protein [Rhizobium sp. YJ-22]MDG3575553.1 hypothetical protein [Rhizobium sp. YJ-22]